MPAMPSSPRARSKWAPSRQQFAKEAQNIAAPGTPSRPRPHTTKARPTKVVAAKGLDGTAGYVRYEYTTNIKQLPISYFQYRYRGGPRSLGNAKVVQPPLVTEPESPSANRQVTKAAKIRRVKTAAAATRARPPAVTDRDDTVELSPTCKQDLQQRPTGHLSSALAERLVMARSASLQHLGSLSDLEASIALDERRSPTIAHPYDDIFNQGAGGILQSSNIIYEPAPRDVNSQKQMPLQSSLLKKSVGSNLYALNLTAVENPTLLSMVRRGAYRLQSTQPDDLDSKLQDISPFASIVRLPPPIIQPTSPVAKRARSAEAVSTSQEIDDSLLDFMFVDL